MLPLIPVGSLVGGVRARLWSLLLCFWTFASFRCAECGRLESQRKLAVWYFAIASNCACFARVFASGMLHCCVGWVGAKLVLEPGAKSAVMATEACKVCTCQIFGISAAAFWCIFLLGGGGVVCYQVHCLGSCDCGGNHQVFSEPSLYVEMMSIFVQQ